MLPINQKAPEAEQLQQLEKNVIQATGMTPTGIAFRNQLNLVVNREKLLLYNIAYEELTRVLRTAFKENKVSTFFCVLTSNICLSALPEKKKKA